MSDTRQAPGRARAARKVDLVAWFSGGWLVLLVGLAATAPLLPLPAHADLTEALSSPVLSGPDWGAGHLLGTNAYGLDLFARALHGSRASLTIALSAVSIGAVLGGAIGILAGYFGRTVDSVVGIATNALLAVPPLILLIALATVLEPTPGNVTLALALMTVPTMVRLARANTMVFVQREFVLAAKAMGASGWRVMARELLPNVLLPVLSMAMVLISTLIVAEASLSFLGLGIQPPEPTWGNMIAEGEGRLLEQHPHVVLVPGTFLFLTVFSFNILGEKARKRWDPRSGKL